MGAPFRALRLSFGGHGRICSGLPPRGRPGGTSRWCCGVRRGGPTPPSVTWSALLRDNHASAYSRTAHSRLHADPPPVVRRSPPDRAGERVNGRLPTAPALHAARFIRLGLICGAQCRSVVVRTQLVAGPGSMHLRGRGHVSPGPRSTRNGSGSRVAPHCRAAPAGTGPAHSDHVVSRGGQLRPGASPRRRSVSIAAHPLTPFHSSMNLHETCYSRRWRRCGAGEVPPACLLVRA